MTAFKVSKENVNMTTDEKVEMVKSYDVGELLTTLRDIENEPQNYDGQVVSTVYGCLYDHHIICM
jgi:hypothetical protein